MAEVLVIAITVAVIVVLGGFALRRRHPEMTATHVAHPDLDDNDPTLSTDRPGGAAVESMLPTENGGDVQPAEVRDREPGRPLR
jgi:hypothetical protein